MNKSAIRTNEKNFRERDSEVVKEPLHFNETERPERNLFLTKSFYSYENRLQASPLGGGFFGGISSDNFCVFAFLFGLYKETSFYRVKLSVFLQNGQDKDCRYGIRVESLKVMCVQVIIQNDRLDKFCVACGTLRIRRGKLLYLACPSPSVNIANGPSELTTTIAVFNCAMILTKSCECRQLKAFKACLYKCNTVDAILSMYFCPTAIGAILDFIIM